MSLISDALKEAQKKRDNLKEKELLDVRTAEVKRRGKSFLIKGVLIVSFLILLSFLPLFILQKKVVSKKTKIVNRKVSFVDEGKASPEKVEHKSIIKKKQPIIMAKKQKADKSLKIKENKKEKKVKSVSKKSRVENTKREDFKKGESYERKLSKKKENIKEEKEKEILDIGKVKEKVKKVGIPKENNIVEADLLIKRGEYKKAELILKDILSKNPVNLKALFDLGTLYLLKGEYYTAYTYYERALKIEPTNEKLLFNTGVSLFKMGRIAEAKLVWKKLYSINRNFPELYYFLGISEDLTKNYDKAKYYYNEYLKYGKNNELKRWVIKRLSQF